MLDSLKADKTRAGGKDEAPASGPANTGTPGKRTPSERARLAALARWGKYKGKGKQKKGGKPKTTAEQKEAARRQKAAENRTATFSELGMFEDATAALEGLAAGKPVEDDGGLVKMGLAERGKDGTLRLTAAGRQVYNAAGRGDVGAAKDAMSRGRDKAPAGADGKPLPRGVSVGADAATTARLKDKAAAEEKPKGGGGGGGAKPKPTPEDKTRAKAEERVQRASATAEAVGLGSLDALRQARDEGGVADEGLRRLGLVGADGLTTDQGRRALTALENGNVGQYRAALQDAAARIEREAAAQAREIERAAAQAERAADTAEATAERERRIRADERRRLLREMGETQKMGDALDRWEAIKQTAQERAMFANMGGGGGGGGGGKPSGGTGGLWKVNPETGKREPSQGYANKPPPAGGERAQRDAGAGKPKEDNAAGTPWTALQAHGALDAPGQRTLGFEGPDGRQVAVMTNSAGRGQHTFSLNGGGRPAQQQQLTTAEARASLTKMHERGYQSRFGLDGIPAKPARTSAGKPKKGDTIYPQGRKEFESRVVRRAPGGVYVRPVNATAGSFADREFFVPDAQASNTFKAEDMDDLDPTDLDPILHSLIDAAEALDPATKAGRRNSATDQAVLDAAAECVADILDMLLSLGATPPDGVELEADEDEADEEAEMDDGAVKMLGNDRVGGYAVRFGSADEPDLSAFHDYFTKSTDFWLDAWQTRPMLYHHAQDEATKDAPVVGLWTSARVDDVGVWVEGQLSAAHRYAGAIKELVKRGVLKLSSDSAPHLVVRERQANGTHEIKRWPLLAASLTPTPAEPRLLPVGALKAAFDAAGLLPPAELIDDSPEADASDPVEVAPDATKTAADERARRLRIELTLLEMEAA